MHKYEIIEQKPLTDSHNYAIGTVIISRCTNCGKIKVTNIKTEERY